jgi:transcriptional regulator with XRE-family HTH domain
MDRFDLLNLRLRAGLRQYQLAALLGVTQTWLCDLERGRRPLTPDMQERICQAIAYAAEQNRPGESTAGDGR